MGTLVLPALEEDEVEKIKKACEAIGNVLSAEITFEEVKSLKITWQNNRTDITSVITEMVDYKLKKKSFKPKSISLGKNQDFDESSLKKL